MKLFELVLCGGYGAKFTVRLILLLVTLNEKSCIDCDNNIYLLTIKFNYKFPTTNTVVRRMGANTHTGGRYTSRAEHDF